MPVRGAAALLLALTTASLGACQRGADSGATANPNAPGSPGRGESAVQAAPQMPDGPPGGPSGVKGSAPHPGSSGGDVVPGTSGRGTNDAGAASVRGGPAGAGLDGGLGGTSAGGTTPPPGSTNRSGGGGAVGQR